MCENVRRPLIYCISGYKNTGKTTLITRLLPVLRRMGYRVAVIKHDGHDFEPDVRESDSWRHKEAGAYGTAVFSGYRFMVTKERRGVTEKDLFPFFPEADIILVEGLKNSVYPKYVCRYPEEVPDVEKIAGEIERLYREGEE